MKHNSYRLGGILLLSIGLASGCASANTTSDDISSDPVQMVVRNRTSSAVTVFAQWRGGTRIRLGEIGARSNRTFTTRYRGPEVRLAVDVLGSPSPGTTSDPRVFSGGAPSFPGRNDDPGSFVPVDPGDRYEWEIRRTIPSVDMFYRRLPGG